jgi:hypothetical protein
LQSLLEFLDLLPLSQLKSLFVLLSNVTLQESSVSALLRLDRKGDDCLQFSPDRLMDDEMHIILRKQVWQLRLIIVVFSADQLTHSSPKYKQIGVVGSLAVLKAVCEAIERKAHPHWTPEHLMGIGVLCFLFLIQASKLFPSPPLSCCS